MNKSKAIIGYCIAFTFLYLFLAFVALDMYWITHFAEWEKMERAMLLELFVISGLGAVPGLSESNK